MIKIRKAIRFSLDEYSIIQGIHTLGLNGAKMWGRPEAKNIKSRIGDHYIRKQRCRCVYCEALLEEGGWAIEHFAPKSKHEDFTFHPKNLFAACFVCNSTKIKGDKDTVNPPKSSKYRKNSFKIIHPYFDNPEEHLFYLDRDRIVLDMPRCTQKGKDTIDFFHWQSQCSITKRILTAESRKLPIDINKLILEISIYK